ncbi:hypothetical protein L2737_16495 [Shewanella electrodiphila]|uniref:Uncharacterized protein n=1 Tax=Shewanella electrodiphila TaxID=934143 RepID=A0ABT0KTH2_9GAMM|nr:hypothetical protein [Shewanella electrodiphila]MCL1046904.1 hypothetical protein [Shewanella electrodiphila]
MVVGKNEKILLVLSLLSSSVNAELTQEEIEQWVNEDGVVAIAKAMATEIIESFPQKLSYFEEIETVMRLRRELTYTVSLDTQALAANTGVEDTLVLARLKKGYKTQVTQDEMNKTLCNMPTASNS